MDELTRRDFAGVAAGSLVSGVLVAAPAEADQQTVRCSLTVNGENHSVDCDPRVTILDCLRDNLHLTGTKKGCDHGQCGACTVLINGQRVLSCLSLTVAHDGDKITTIEGLATSFGLHPLQTAFIENDGFQCGFCTSGQICSAVGMLKEWNSGMPSALTFASPQPTDLTEPEIRERMAGNICRCGAYPNIVAAIKDVHEGGDGKGNRS